MPEQQNLKVLLHLDKETRNTVRYNADPGNDTAAVDSLYIKKFALGGQRPKTITLTLDLHE